VRGEGERKRGRERGEKGGERGREGRFRERVKGLQNHQSKFKTHLVL
jgi:hypothetical protein